MSNSLYAMTNETIYPQSHDFGDSIPNMIHLVMNIGIDCIAPKKATSYDEIVTSGVVTLISSESVPEALDDAEKMVQKALKVIFPKGPKSSSLKNSYEQYEVMFHCYYVGGCNQTVSCKQADIGISTGSNYIRKVREIIGDKVKANVAAKPSGNKKLLEEHTKFLVAYYEDHEFSLLKDAYKSLRSKFDDLDVADSTIYSHLRKKCCLVIKSIGMKENCDVGEQCSIMMDEIDLLNDCIFITTKRFYMFERESFGWSRSAAGKNESKLTDKGGISFSLIASFCDSGVINACLNTTIIKENETSASNTMSGKKGNVHTEFMDGMMDKVQNNGIQKKYVVVDGMGSKGLKRVTKIIESFGYKCIAVKSLSATDDFWNALKDRTPRHHVDHNNLFVPRLQSAVKQLTASDCRAVIDKISKEGLSG
jgi:hypothetical protein